MIKSFWGGRVAITKKRLIVASILALLSLLLCIFLADSLKAGLVFAVAFLLITPFSVNMEVSRGGTVGLYCTLGVCCAAATLLASQLAVDQIVFALPAVRILLGILICLVPMALLFAVTLRFRLSVLLGAAISLLLTTANIYVYLFRGNELTPSDLLSVGTAANVVSAYTFTVPKNLLFAWLLFALMTVFLSAISLPKVQKSRLYARLCSAVMAIVCVLCLVFSTGNLTALNWQNSGSVSNGYLLNFLLQLKATFITEPEGYDPDALDEFAQNYLLEEGTDAGRYPDIIVIMNESLADLSVLGSEPATDTELLPFYRSLSENTIKGYALASVMGGRTPNSEFEFLTANSTAFLPDGSVPYQQYIKKKQYSMATVLSDYGYSTMATHPCDSSNWMRDTVWEKLGFEEYTFEEDYPQADLLRGHVSDAEMYRRLIEYYEARTQQGNVFLFGVTMQNHGPYNIESFESTVSLQGYSRDYPEVEQYLTVVNESDAALRELIEYFQQSERPVVIAMFGDHLPNLPKAFYEELHGGTFDTLDEQMLQYKVPFLVWANYDIEEAYVECTSLSFLSSYVYRAAGIPLPPYHQFLSQLEKVVPSMNAFGYYCVAEGCYLPYDRLSADAAEIVAWYERLQYNNLFDPKHRNPIFFPLD